MSMTTDELRGRAYASLVCGLVGDAMGTPTENLEPEQIEARLGWVTEFEGVGTDDSLMKDLLADALLETGGYATSDDWARQMVQQRAQIIERRDKFFPSVLHLLSKLGYGFAPRTVNAGTMPSSSSAMAIAPVGIVNAGHPRAAAAQAQEIAGLIHTGEVGFCQDAAAAIAAAVAAALAPQATIAGSVDAATVYLAPISGELMRGLILEALALARSTGEYKAFRSAYQARFRQTIACDSRETVPATLAICLLAEGDPVRAIEYGANFGRDTDTIATMAGAICGALRGPTALPSGWAEKVTTRGLRDQHVLAERLVRVAIEKAHSEVASWRSIAGLPDMPNADMAAER